MRRIFTRYEWIFVLAVLVGLLAVSLLSFQVAQKKSRDAQRREAVSRLSDALGEFLYDHDRYPGAEGTDGRILGCGSSEDRPMACPWGEMFYEYMRLPKDPLSGRTFFYEVSSDGAKFKVWTSLELPTIVDLNLGGRVPNCGNVRCNYGQASPGTDIGKPI